MLDLSKPFLIDIHRSSIEMHKFKLNFALSILKAFRLPILYLSLQNENILIFF
jgi:hypothetical protein